MVKRTICCRLNSISCSENCVFVKKKIKDEQNSSDTVEYANLIQACMQIQDQYLRVSDMVRRNRPTRAQIAGVYNVK